MKIIILFVASLFVLPFYSFAQEEAPATSHVAAAVHLLDNMNMQETLDKTIDATLQAQMAQMPQMKSVEGVMRDFFKKYMSYDALRDDLAQLYVKHYSEQELNDLYTFYQTPLGKKLAEKTPEITTESMIMGQNVVQEHMSELQEAIMKKMAEDENN